MQAKPFVSPILAPGKRVILGEGPLVLGEKLLTTDARRSLIRSTDLSTSETYDTDLSALLRDAGLLAADAPNPVLGCIAPTKDGSLLAALATGIYKVDLERETIQAFSHPEAERRDEKPHYNDGKIGPDGAFYVGGMIGGKEGAGRLLRIGPKGDHEQPMRGNPPLTTPNGMHWFATDDPDVWDFFYVCSQYPAIQRYRHIVSECRMLREDDLISLPRKTFGFLDGMTGTDNGLLILALYLPIECGCIVIDSRTGEIIERIGTEIPQTTSVALRGSDIYITTAAQEYGDKDFAAHPDAGAVFHASALDAEDGRLREAREDIGPAAWRFPG